jgi:hypothetical protein
LEEAEFEGDKFVDEGVLERDGRVELFERVVGDGEGEIVGGGVLGVVIEAVESVGEGVGGRAGFAGGSAGARPKEK